jgi:hypothetical protein
MNGLTRRQWFSTLATAFVLPWLPKPKLAPKPELPALDAITETTRKYLGADSGLTDNFFVTSPFFTRLNGLDYYDGGSFIRPSFALPRPTTEGTAEELTPLIVPYSTIPCLVSPGNGAN